MQIDHSRLFAIEAIAETARAAYLAATARRDRVSGWLDAQRRHRISDDKGRPPVPPAMSHLSPAGKRQTANAIAADAEAKADASEARAASQLSAVARLEADLQSASADVERAAQAQAQTRALADACRKLAGGHRHG